MGLNFSDIAYDNILRDDTPIYSGTTLAGREPINATDWRDFSTFDPGDTTTPRTFDVSCSSTRTATIFYLYTAVVPVSATVALQYESAPSVFTTIATISPVAKGMNYANISTSVAASRKLRLVISGTTAVGQLLVRQAFVGPKMTFTVGQWDGIAPHALSGGIVMENTISENGSVLARNRRRVEKTGKISLEHLDPAWVRSTWEPFLVHATRYMFFYRWAPTDYPTDIAFCAAEEIPTPTNMQPPPFMTAMLPYKCITS